MKTLLGSNFANSFNGEGKGSVGQAAHTIRVLHPVDAVLYVDTLRVVGHRVSELRIHSIQ